MQSDTPVTAIGGVNGVDMGAQRLLVTAVAGGLQHAEQASLTQRFDVGRRHLAGLLSLDNALAQLWDERSRASDKLFMAELFGSAIRMSS